MKILFSVVVTVICSYLSAAQFGGFYEFVSYDDESELVSEGGTVCAGQTMAIPVTGVSSVSDLSSKFRINRLTAAVDDIGTPEFVTDAEMFRRASRGDYPWDLWPNDRAKLDRYWALIPTKARAKRWYGFPSFTVSVGGAVSPVLYIAHDYFLYNPMKFRNVTRGVDLESSSKFYCDGVGFEGDDVALQWQLRGDSPFSVDLFMPESGVLVIAGKESHIGKSVMKVSRISGGSVVSDTKTRNTTLLDEACEQAVATVDWERYFELYGELWAKYLFNNCEQGSYVRRIRIDGATALRLATSGNRVSFTRMHFFPDSKPCVAVDATFGTVLTRDEPSMDYSYKIYLQGYVRGNGVYKVGETARLTAVPAPGERFDHWECTLGNVDFDAKNPELEFRVTEEMCGSAAEERQILFRAVWVEKKDGDWGGYAVKGVANDSQDSFCWDVDLPGVDYNWRRHVEHFETVGGVEWGYRIEGGHAVITYFWPRRLSSVTVPATLGGCPVTDLAWYEYSNPEDDLGRKWIGVFAGCDLLRTISFPAGLWDVDMYSLDQTAWWNALGDGFIIAGDLVLGYRGTAPATLSIPDTVKSIAPYAFSEDGHCSGDLSALRTMNIPASVTRIGTGAFSYSEIKRVNFAGTPLYVGAGILDCTRWIARQGVGLISAGGWILGYRSSLDSEYDSEYGLLWPTEYFFPENLVIPEGTYGIAPDAFYRDSGWWEESDDDYVYHEGYPEGSSAIRTLVLPESLKSIGDFAFYGQNEISEVKVPARVKRIGVCAFGAMGATCRFLGKRPTVYSYDWSPYDDDDLHTVFGEDSYGSDPMPSRIESCYFRRGADGWTDGETWQGVKTFAYDLPLEVAFESTTVKVSEDASYAEIKVIRKSVDGSGRIGFSTRSDTATAGIGGDFYATAGELEFGVDDLEKIIRIRLLPDMVPRYEGNEKFYVDLAPYDGVSVLGATSCKVKLIETKPFTPGIVDFANPSPTVFPCDLEWTPSGWLYPVVLTRKSGADGRVAVQVRGVSGTAVIGEDFDFTTTVVEWVDGDDGDKEVYVSFNEYEYEYNTNFKIKLAVQSDGEYADCAVPALARTKSVITLGDGCDCPGCCIDTPEFTGRTRKFTVNGPALFSVLPYVDVEGSDESVMVKFRVGSGEYQYAEAGEEIFLTVPSGASVVTVKAVCDKECEMYFEERYGVYAHGDYVLMPLSVPDAVRAIDGTLKGWASSYGGQYTEQVLDLGEITVYRGVSEDRYLSELNPDIGDCINNGAYVELVGGGVPTGMKFKGGSGKVCKSPSISDEYTEAVFRLVWPNSARTPVGVANTYTPYFRVGFYVEDPWHIAGSYRGAFDFGWIKLKVSSSGTMTASVKTEGNTYSFSAASFSHREEVEESGVFYRALLTGEAGYVDIELNESTGGVGKGTVRLFESDSLYEFDLYQQATVDDDDDDVLMRRNAGYYTMGLVPEGVTGADGLPAGNGYITMTVSTNAAVTGAGRLSDGTEFSFSSIGQFIDEELFIPIYVWSSPSVVSGLIRVRDGVVCPTSLLRWRKTGKYSDYSRNGFVETLRPVGGVYSSIQNLQAYYYGRGFAVRTPALDGLPSYLLPSGWTYTAYTTPRCSVGYFTGNEMTPNSRSLVSEWNGRYNLQESVNPCKVKTSFNRATGIVTGTFKLWSDDDVAQSQFATVNHYGVHLMTWESSLLPDETLTLGFYLLPVTSKWTLSMPFDLLLAAE